MLGAVMEQGNSELMSSPAQEGSAAQTATSPAEAPSPASAAPEFLTSLIDAMRRVVEASRDSKLAELKATADAETGQLDARRTEREAALRELSELDINGIGAWERSEIERIRGEAVSRVAARREQLDKELAELVASTEAERAALWGRADAYEQQVSTFMEELAGINDPTAFATAAGRMPSVPAHVSPGTQVVTATTAAPREPAAETASAPGRPPNSGSPVPSQWTAPAVADRLAALNQQLGRDADALVPQEAEVATAIEVQGLGSFGAITSLKQSLEKVSGIRSVALALGPSGDFVYTAVHPEGFDVAAAIRAIEGEAVQIDRDNGTLRVKVARAVG